MKKTGATQAEFDRSLRKWTAHWKPVDAMEQELVRRIAEHEWLVQRVLCVQQEFVTKNGGVPVPELLQLLKFQTVQERAFLTSASMLQELRDFHVAEANGFVSQKSIKAKKHDANEGNPWMNMDLDPFTECGWADPITGKFTPFGDGFAAELAEEEALAEAEREKNQAREEKPTT